MRIVLSNIFNFGQIYKFKKGVTPRKKTLNQNFLWICTSTHYVLHYYKLSGNSVEQFQRSCADKKNRTDILTDWLTDGSKTLYPLQLVAWGIIKSMVYHFLPHRWGNLQEHVIVLSIWTLIAWGNSLDFFKSDCAMIFLGVSSWLPCMVSSAIAVVIGVRNPVRQPPIIHISWC